MCAQYKLLSSAGVTKTILKVKRNNSGLCYLLLEIMISFIFIFELLRYYLNTETANEKHYGDWIQGVFFAISKG